MIRTSWVRLGVIAFLVAAATGLAGAATVQKIVVKSMVAKLPVSEEMVLNSVRAAPGQPFNPEALKEDVKRLVRTGFFADVQYKASNIDDEHVLITFELTPNPKVTQLRVDGNSRIKTKKLTDLLKLKEGMPLDEQKVTDDTTAIRKLYQDKGYYQTDVVSDVQAPPNTTGEVHVTYKITEEERYKIASVAFHGNTKQLFSDRDLRRKLQNKFSWWSYIFRTGYMDKEKRQADKDALYDLYTGKGYLDFKIANIEEHLTADHKWVNLVYLLTEGEPYMVKSVSIEGATKFPAADLMNAVDLRTKRKVVSLTPGQRFDAAVERADVESLRARYEVLGYLDMKLVPQHKLDNASHTVAVAYVIVEGQPSRIHDIHISGNDVTQEQVIRRELTILPGDLGDAGKIRTSKNRLMGMNYFESVDVTPAATEKEDEKDLEFLVKEKRTGQLMIGAGFSSEDSIVGMLEVSQANFDWRNWPTFTGGGQHLRLRLQAGTERQDYVLSFTEPWLMDRPLRFDWDLYLHERDQDYYTQTNLGTQIMLTKALKEDTPEGSEWRNWKHAAGFRLERIELGSFDDQVSQSIKDEEGSYNATTLIYRLTRDTRDRYLNPTSGSRVTFTGEVEPEALGSYSNIYRLNGEASKYFPVLRSCVLKLEAEMGTVNSMGGDEPALFDRYFAGGTGSLRGFKRRAVGPIDDFENPIGGKSLMRGTTELIYPIYDMIRGSVFMDFGNVWANATEWNVSDVNVTVGLGIQLDLPVGPIRLDYGFPIIRREDNLSKSGRLDFNLGYFF